MGCFEIEGGYPLGGRLEVQGAKNSVLPILAATLLAPGQSLIRNCPDLTDVSAALSILTLLGCRVERSGTDVTVDASCPTRWDIPEGLMGEMRASVTFLGAVLARLGRVELSCPGGCMLGPRPIDLHLSALSRLGAAVREDRGRLCCTGGRTMAGREICLPIPSVGATENIMLAACGCPGTTTVVGAAREPEITDLQTFLRSMGAEVSGAGTPVICIEGGKPLHPAEHRVVGDRIAAATYLCAVGAAGGEVELAGADPSHLTAVLSCLEGAGCAIRAEPGRMVLRSTGSLRGIPTVTTAPYPGFPTDAQAILMAALAGGRGTTVFVENIFDSRYHHVDELRRMGARITTHGRVAVVTGAGRLHGARVRSADLRGGAALAVAALGAEGTTRLAGLRHIRRGYDGLDRDLRALGAHMIETEETD